MGSWSSWISAGSKHVNSFGSYSRFYLDTTYRYKVDGTTVSYEIKLTARYYNTTGTGGNGTYDDAIDVRLVFNGSDKGWVQVAAAKKWYHGDTASHTFTGLSVTTSSAGTVPITCYENNHSNHSRFDNPSVSYNITRPAPETCTITYNDNGGSGGPGSQTKTIGTDIYLSSTKPTKPETVTAGYTITFSDSYGEPDYTSYTTKGVTSYTFDHWNTAADNSGTSYASGALYTGNSNVTLYAIYSSSVVSFGVSLPKSARPGYFLKGWARGSASGTIVEDGYTPTQNETLYAAWDALVGKINYKNNSTWIPTMVKYKSGSSWYTSLQTHVLPMTLSNFYIEGTEYTFPVPCTWGEWLHSKYNTDFMYADKINGEWRVVVEEAASSSAFVLSDLSFTSEAEMWNTYITIEYDYNIERVYYYYRLEFIKGSGTQYINTGIQPTANMRAEIDYALHSASDDQKFFGAYSDSAGVCLGTYNNLWRYGAGTWQGNQGSTVTYRVKIVCTGNQFTFNGTTYTNSASISAYSSNIFLGGINYQGSFLQGDSGEIYGLKLYQGNTLVRDMVPCYRGSSVGMYDKVNKVFYNNAGTGTYIKGYERDW